MNKPKSIMADCLLENKEICLTETTLQSNGRHITLSRQKQSPAETYRNGLGSGIYRCWMILARNYRADIFVKLSIKKINETDFPI